MNHSCYGLNSAVNHVGGWENTPMLVSHSGNGLWINLF